MIARMEGAATEVPGERKLPLPAVTVENPQGVIDKGRSRF